MVLPVDYAASQHELDRQKNPSALQRDFEVDLQYLPRSFFWFKNKNKKNPQAPKHKSTNKIK